MDQKNLELKSDDVQEILGTPPSWLVRWGTFMMGLVLLSLIVVCWKWQYADEVLGELVLTTSNLPEKVFAKTDGTVAAMLVKEGQKVERGSQLLVLESAALFEDIIHLESHLDSVSKLNSINLNNYNLPTGLRLGELQKDYNELEQKIRDFKFSNRQVMDVDQIAEYNKHIAGIKEDIDNIRSQQKRNVEILKDRERTLEEAKKTYAKDVKNPGYSKSLYDASADFRATQSQIRDYELEIKRKEREIDKINYNIKGVKRGAIGENKDQLEDIQNGISYLKQAIENWKTINILTAPISGSIIFRDYYSPTNFYKRGNPVIAIQVDRDAEIKGQATVSIEEANKVKKGQTAHLKLTNFPSHRHGYLEGTIISKKEQYDQGNCVVEIQLSNGMRTTIGEDLPFVQNMIGNVEIITEKRSMLERLFGKASRLIFGE